ncbi:hypothetical protein ANN_07054 [Periplaneta americana]|uniref:Uncharacterized protein n=1 Tax=Periplaneta americana TaxID=6978 RepID=A0ABQ8TG53_PERAM|nr:hypothetical protein ANN_07054 [Periplaneta americana]
MEEHLGLERSFKFFMTDSSMTLDIPLFVAKELNDDNVTLTLAEQCAAYLCCNLRNLQAKELLIFTAIMHSAVRGARVAFPDTSLNDIIKRSLTSCGIPSLLERPDGALISRGIDSGMSLWLRMQQIHPCELRTDARGATDEHHRDAEGISVHVDSIRPGCCS